ncbi:MAG: pilus assembly protein PilM [Proteobacteria bacterium]|nr:pilus assembly protein PilM [Pseudomonadota bacterium]
MSLLKEATSTEKLLNTIRNKKTDTDNQASHISAIESQNNKPKSFMSNSFVSEKKPVTIGVDIGHECLRLVKTTKASDKNRIFLGYKIIPYANITSRKSPEFAGFIKAELLKFFGADREVNIWANMSTARVNVRHLRIPKVSKKQIENAISWAIKRETPFDDNDTSLDFEILGEIKEDNIAKLYAVAYTAPKDEIKEIKNLFSEIGLQLDGISITPFALQNILKTVQIPDFEGTVACLFIGNDFSRIDIYAHGKLVMTRGIRAGINSMVEALMESISTKAYDDSEGFNEKEGGNAAAIAKEIRKALISLSPDSEPLTENDIGFELKEEEKFKVIALSLERIVRQVERTFEYYTANLKYDRIERIYISTAMNVYMPIVKYIGDQLGMESDILDPVKFNLPNFESLAGKATVSDRIALTPVLGLALSDNDYTPNLLFRFKDKEKLAATLRITNIVFAFLIFFAVFCGGLFMYQKGTIKQRKAGISHLEKQMFQYEPSADQAMISQMISSSEKKQLAAKEYKEKYFSMAVISELTSIIPVNIRLIDFKAELGNAKPDKKLQKINRNITKENTEKKMLLEGLVFGDENTLESSLAGFIVKLDDSPIFGEISIKQNKVKPFKEKKVLHFIIETKMID